MTTEEEITQIQDERDDARQNLRDTLTEVNAKVERASNDLRPDHLLEAHPFGACLIASTLGFLLGANVKNHGTGPIIIAALVGFALSRDSLSVAGGNDDRESSAGD
jgi:hypothetical protein